MIFSPQLVKLYIPQHMEFYWKLSLALCLVKQKLEVMLRHFLKSEHCLFIRLTFKIGLKYHGKYTNISNTHWALNSMSGVVLTIFINSLILPKIHDESGSRGVALLYKGGPWERD